MPRELSVVPFKKKKMGRPVTTRGFPYIGMRIPPELRDWLIKQAEKNDRSLSGEVTHRLLLSMRRSK